MAERLPHARVSAPQGVGGGRLQPLDQKEVVSAALQIVKDVGVDGLTMRLLAERLNVSVAAAYKHVDNRATLLRLAADVLFSRVVEADPADGTWADRVRTLMVGFYDVMTPFPGMSAYIALQSDAIPKRRMTDLMLEILVAAGFSAAEAWGAMTTLVFYSAGALDGPLGSMDLGEHKQRMLRDAYRRGLDTILDGLGVALERQGPDEQNPRRGQPVRPPER